MSLTRLLLFVIIILTVLLIKAQRSGRAEYVRDLEIQNRVLRKMMEDSNKYLEKCGYAKRL